MVMFFSSFLLYLMPIKLFSEVWAVLSSSVWRRLLCHRCARASGCSQRGLCEVCRCSSQHREIRHPAAKNHQACKSDRHVDLSGRYKAPPSCRSVTGAPENRTLSPVGLCGSSWRFVSEDPQTGLKAKTNPCTVVKKYTLTLTLYYKTQFLRWSLN